MFILNLKLTKNKVLQFAIILFAVLLTVIGIFYNFSQKTIKGEDTDMRQNYLTLLGYDLDEGSEEKTLITIPDDFGTTYSDYNKKQTSAGFNLSKFKGYDATVYTYSLSGFENCNGVWANLIVIDGKIVGGDISSIENGGFILPLKTYKENQKILNTYVTET